MAQIKTMFKMIFLIGSFIKAVSIPRASDKQLKLLNSVDRGLLQHNGVYYEDSAYETFINQYLTKYQNQLSR